MNGYVLNASNSWTHAMKRAVAPAAKIPLKDLYEQYGVKYGIPEGEEFIKWLRNVKLKDSQRWKIVYEQPKTEESKNSELTTQSVDVKKTSIEKMKPENVAPFIDKTKMSVTDVVGLSVRQAREVLPKFTDIKLLQYALQEANQLAGKDSLCRVIRKRIKELKISR